MMEAEHKHKVQQIDYLIEKTYCTTQNLSDMVGFRPGSSWIYQMKAKGRALREDQVEKIVEHFENLAVDLRADFSELKKL